MIEYYGNEFMYYNFEDYNYFISHDTVQAYIQGPGQLNVIHLHVRRAEGEFIPNAL